MGPLSRRISLPLLLLALSSLTATAQESRPAGGEKTGVTADAKAIELLDRADSLIYYAPVEKASCQGELEFTNMMSPEPKTGTFRFFWNGEKGKAEFSEPALAMQAQQSGFQVEVIEGLYKRDPWREKFEGCSLTTTEKDGKKVVQVEGQNEDGVRSITIGESGLWEELVLQAPTMPQPASISIEYTGLGEKFAQKQMSMKMDFPGMGEMQARMDYAYVKVGPFHVLSSYTAKIEMGGQSMGTVSVSLKDHKFNEEAGDGPSASSPPNEDQPATPKKKAGGS